MKNIFKKPSMLRLRPRDTMKVCSTCPVLSLSKYMIGYWKKKGDGVQKEREREREREREKEREREIERERGEKKLNKAKLLVCLFGSRTSSWKRTVNFFLLIG
jgi:hypothetical protein